MANVEDVVIKPALRKIGNPSPGNTQKENALSDFNDMLSSLSVDDIVIPYFTRENFPLVVGQASYTIGSGGDFDTVRPTLIKGAYIRDVSGDDHPVEVNMTLEQYNAITTKSSQLRPTRLLYLTEYLLGKIIFDYAVAEIETLYLDTLKPLTRLAALDTTITIPQEYNEFLIYNLAIRLVPDNDMELDPVVAAIAQTSYQRVVTHNYRHQADTVPMDYFLVNYNAMNINSD
jgi:hypothetical protein